jgi:hypothetical protein
LLETLRKEAGTALFVVKSKASMCMHAYWRGDRPSIEELLKSQRLTANIALLISHPFRCYVLNRTGRQCENRMSAEAEKM